MSGGSKTTTQRIDPASQRYVSGTRGVGASGARSLLGMEGNLYGPETMSVQDQAMQFMNPWFDQVLNPVNQSFDRALDMNRMRTNDAAQGAGAFGSARHGVAEAVGMGEVERGRASVLGNLLNNQWQTAVNQGLSYQAQQRQAERMAMMEPFLRSQMAVGLRNQALGPTGQTTKEKQSGNTFGQIAGLGLGLAGTLMMGGPAGGALGSSLGRSLFGNATSGGVNALASPGLQYTPQTNLTQPGGWFSDYYR